MTHWFARPVFHVTDVEASLTFYSSGLGFASSWTYRDNGKARVAQIERQNCILILAETWPEKVGRGLVFISLNISPDGSQDIPEASAAALDALRKEFENRGVSVKEGWWGYRVLVIDDPDGNQLFFNYPNETAAGEIERR